MPIHSVQFFSVDEAENFTPNESTVAISILSPGRVAACLHAIVGETLRLYFHDGVPKKSNPPETVLFSTEQAEAVIDFLRRHHTQPEARHLIIHCEAGISRSAAIAVFAASECQVPLSGQFAFLNPWVLDTLVRSAYPHYSF